MGWSTTKSLWLLCLCTAPAALPLAQSRDAGASGIYSCVDAHGRRLTADRPIPACLDREQRMLGASGVEKSRMGPSLTEQEKFDQEQRLRHADRERALSQDARRREQILRQRYPRPELHDAARRAALVQIDDVIAVAQRRMEALRVERGQQEQELEFYAKDATLVPGSVQRAMADIDSSMDQLLRFIQSQQQERRRIVQRFDAEQQQLLRMWADAAADGGKTSH